MKKTKDYIVKLKPVIKAGWTRQDAGVELEDLRWHVYAIASTSKIRARGKALDLFHGEVPIKSMERVDILDQIAIVEFHDPEPVTHCCYCGGELGYTIDPDSDSAPAADDDAAWEREAKTHLPNCEWVCTRAHRRNLPKEPQPARRNFVVALELDGQAFGDEPELETARILGSIAASIGADGFVDAGTETDTGAAAGIWDHNGNWCGFWRAQLDTQPRLDHYRWESLSLEELSALRTALNLRLHQLHAGGRECDCQEEREGRVCSRMDAEMKLNFERRQ